VSHGRRSGTALALRSGKRWGKSVALVRAAMRDRDPSSERPPRPGSSVDSNKPGQNRSVLSDTSTGRRRRRRRRASRLLGEPTHAMCLLSRTLHVVDAGQLRVLLVDMTTSSTGVVMATYRRAGDIQHGSSPSPGRPTRRWSAASLSPRTAPDSSDGGAELLVVCARRP